MENLVISSYWILISLTLSQIAAQCTLANFPKVFGSSNGMTVCRTLDYSANIDAIASGGFIIDSVFRGDSDYSQSKGYIALY